MIVGEKKTRLPVYCLPWELFLSFATAGEQKASLTSEVGS